MSNSLNAALLVGLLAWLVAGPSAQADEPAARSDRSEARWTIEHHGPAALTPVPAPAPAAKLLAAGDLVLDDGTREADVGVNSSTAFQFLWFNQFDPGGESFALDEIQVLFPPGPGVVPGAAIQLVVFTDADGDPTNGADLVAAWDDVIQVADGTTFSVYAVDPPLTLPPSSDVLLGVVNRYVDSGVSPPSRPAALDTSSSAGRSWLAEWTGDPPDPPTLPTDSVLEPIDTVEPGNWMIRGAGTPLGAVSIPTLDPVALAALASLLMLAAVALLRHR